MIESTVAGAIAAMQGKRALLVGDLLLDTYEIGETVRVSREAPVLVVRRERSEHRLGGAANAAANLAALGLTTTAVATVGGDAAGETLRRLLGAAAVGLEEVATVGRRTPNKTRVLAGAFGTARQQVLRLDDEPDEQLPDEVVARLAEAVRRLGRQVEVVLASDYGAGVCAPPVVEALRDLARAGVPVVVDSRAQLAAFRGVTVVTPNVPEAAALVGAAVAQQSSVDAAGAEILRRLGCGACLVTQGRHGMTLYRPGTPPRHVDIIGDDEVTDVTGAGDTVAATLAAALGAGLGLANGMLLANSAAGVAVMKAGTATVSPAELVAMAERGRVELEPWAG